MNEDRFTYEEWGTEELRIIPYPTSEAFLVARQMLHADANGPLHIIVADGNLEDFHLNMCFEKASPSERRLIDEIRKLSNPQRQAAWHYAAYGQLNPPGTT